MSDIVKTLNKRITSTKENSVLARLWRKILMETGIAYKVPFLLNNYTRKSDEKRSNANKRKTRSSLKGDLIAEELTWKSFSNLVFNLLSVKSIKVTIDLTHVNNSVTTHSITVDKEVVNEYNKEHNKKESNEQDKRDS